MFRIFPQFFLLITLPYTNIDGHSWHEKDGLGALGNTFAVSVEKKARAKFCKRLRKQCCPRLV